MKALPLHLHCSQQIDRINLSCLSSIVPAPLFATAKNSNGDSTKIYRSNTSHTKNTDGAVTYVSELESSQWKNVFRSYLQSREDESDGENDELVQVMMLE